MSRFLFYVFFLFYFSFSLASHEEKNHEVNGLIREVFDIVDKPIVEDVISDAIQGLNKEELTSFLRNSILRLATSEFSVLESIELYQFRSFLCLRFEESEIPDSISNEGGWFRVKEFIFDLRNGCNEIEVRVVFTSYPYSKPCERFIEEKETGIVFVKISFQNYWKGTGK